MQVDDEMQLQAKALADPSRFKLFRHIVEAADPVGVAELTELLGFNHNAIRQHLSVLVDADLVAETTERRTVRGRPRKEFTARLDALHAFRSVSGSYERLAALLLEVVTSGADPYEVGHRASMAESGDQASLGSVEEAIDQLVRRLTADGFEPDRLAPQRLALLHCPFADVASQGPGIVCELHRGLIDGHLEANGHDLVGDLQPKDPQRAGCRVSIRKSDDGG